MWEWLLKRKVARAERRYNRRLARQRADAEFRASNGEYIPDAECEALNLPEWCAHPTSRYRQVSE